MDDLEAALTKGYRPEQIGSAMVNYNSIVTAEGVLLNKAVPGHVVGLNQFFGFNRFTKESIEDRNIVASIKSWFKECIQGRDYLFEKYARSKKADRYPDITNVLRDCWKKTPYYVGAFTSKDERNFAKAAELFVVWYDKNIDHVNTSLDDPAAFIKKYLFPSIEYIVTLQKRDPVTVTTTWIAAADTFDRGLVAFLKYKGIFQGGGGGIHERED